MLYLVDADENPVDERDSHHLLQVFHGRVLIDLLHYEVGNEFGNVPLRRKDIKSV